MRTFRAGLFLCAVLLLTPATAPAAASLKVTSAAVCDIDADAESCDANARTFSHVSALRFVTIVEGATGEAWVEHVWKHEGREVFRLKLPIRAHRCRTFSKKTVAGLPGAWTAVVLDPVGRELASVAFDVEESRAAQAAP